MDTTPVLDGLLTGAGFVGAMIYAQIQYTKTQTRILTATDGWLDYVANDFFGNDVTRAVGETDTTFRAFIEKNLLRQKATRPSLTSVVFDNTGENPVIVEGMLLTDLGVTNVGTLACNQDGGYAGAGLGFQTWVDVFRNGSGLSDAQLYQLVESVRPVGTTDWVQIQN